MQILFTRFPLESAHGGAENQTMWLADGLRARGHDVRFLGSCHVLVERFAAGNFPTMTLEIGPPPVTKWSAISFLWRKKKMKEKLVEASGNWLVAIGSQSQANSHKPTAVFMLSVSEKLLMTEHLHAQGVKVFWIEHDRVGSWLTWNPWLPALKKAAEHATIICVSELSRRKYVALGFKPERIIVIPNGVPIPTSAPVSHASSKTLQLGCVSRLSPEKGVDVLLQAIANIPEVTLSIVGTGPQEGYLRSLIHADTNRIGVERIHLVSRVQDLGAFYSSIDAFALPSSDHDPFGLVAAEAMSYGIPTVITDACGIAGSLAADKEVLVASAGSPASLEAAIKQLLDPTIRARLSVNGKQAVISRLSVEPMVKGYEQILR